MRASFEQGQERLEPRRLRVPQHLVDDRLRRHNEGAASPRRIQGQGVIRRVAAPAGVGDEDDAPPPSDQVHHGGQDADVGLYPEQDRNGPVQRVQRLVEAVVSAAGEARLLDVRRPRREERGQLKQGGSDALGVLFGDEQQIGRAHV